MMRTLMGLLLLTMWPGLASADTRVNIVGLFSGKAVVVINGAAPHPCRWGNPPGGRQVGRS